jgi:hypothetical protein
MYKIRLPAIALIIVTSLVGCAGHSTQMLGTIDPSDRTVATPAGTKGIVGPVKRVLHDEGWQVDEFDRVKSRYKLHFNTVRTQLLCINEWSEISYELFFVDNSDGKPIFVISGDSCDSFSDVAEAFRAALSKAKR